MNPDCAKNTGADGAMHYPLHGKALSGEKADDPWNPGVQLQDASLELLALPGLRNDEKAHTGCARGPGMGPWKLEGG